MSDLPQHVRAKLSDMRALAGAVEVIVKDLEKAGISTDTADAYVQRMRSNADEYERRETEFERWARRH